MVLLLRDSTRAKAEIPQLVTAPSPLKIEYFPLPSTHGPRYLYINPYIVIENLSSSSPDFLPSQASPPPLSSPTDSPSPTFLPHTTPLTAAENPTKTPSYLPLSLSPQPPTTIPERKIEPLPLNEPLSDTPTFAFSDGSINYVNRTLFSTVPCLSPTLSLYRNSHHQLSVFKSEFPSYPSENTAASHEKNEKRADLPSLRPPAPVPPWKYPFSPSSNPDKFEEYDPTYATCFSALTTPRYLRSPAPAPSMSWYFGCAESINRNFYGRQTIPWREEPPGSDAENRKVINVNLVTLVESMTSKDIVPCEHAPVTGLSRLKLESYSGVRRIADLLERFHHETQVCLHRNYSFGLCQCENDNWDRLRSGILSPTITPCEHRYINVKFVNQLSGSASIVIELEYFKWRLIGMAISFVLLTPAPIVLSWIPCYLFLEHNFLTRSILEMFKLFGNLRQLELWYNQNVGLMPNYISKFPLMSVVLNLNNFTGFILVSLWSSATLMEFFAENILLCVSIPAEIDNTALLTGIVLSNIRITGRIPEVVLGIPDSSYHGVYFWTDFETNVCGYSRNPVGFVVPGVSPALRRSSANETFHYTSRNGMDLDEGRNAIKFQLTSNVPCYNNESALQYLPPVPNGRKKASLQVRVPQGSINTLTREDSLIIHDEGLNHEMDSRYTRLRGSHLKERVHYEIADEKLGENRSHLKSYPHVAAVQDGFGSPRKSSLFSLSSKYIFLAEAQGYTYDSATDQPSYQFLQRKLDEGVSQEALIIFNEIIDHVVELTRKPFGNYPMQKLLDVCNEEHKMHILQKVAEESRELVGISHSIHEIHVVQKLIETPKIQLEFGQTIHILQVSWGQVKDGERSKNIPLWLKIESTTFVIGTLSVEDRPQVMFYLVSEREFELSYVWENGSTYFGDYNADDPALDGDEFSWDDYESEDELKLEAPENGVVAKAKAGTMKPAEKVVGPKAGAKVKTKEEEAKKEEEWLGREDFNVIIIDFSNLHLEDKVFSEAAGNDTTPGPESNIHKQPNNEAIQPKAHPSSRLQPNMIISSTLAQSQPSIIVLVTERHLCS